MEEESTLDELIFEATQISWDIRDLQNELEVLNQKIRSMGGDPV